MAAENAEVQRLRLRRADRQDLVVLQHAQQLHLHGHRDVGEFVEEDRAAVGEEELAGPRLGRPGEGAARVAEQLALDEVGIEGGDVDRQEGPVAAGAVAVNGAGDELLSGSAFSGDEHGGVARRHQGDALERGLHHGAAADELLRVGGVGVRRRGGVRRRPALQRPVDRLQRLAQVERLGEVVEGAVLHGPDGGGEVAERGDDDHRGVGGQLAQPAQRRQAVHAGQAHVEDDGVGPLLGRERERLLGGGGRGDGMAFGGQGALQRPADRFLIVHNQDVFHGYSSEGTRRDFRGDQAARATASYAHR